MSHHTPELARRRGGTTNGASSNQGWSGVDVAEPPDLGSESDFTGLNDNGSAVDGSGTTVTPGLDTSGEYTEEADTAAGADEEGNEDDSETLESVRQATTCLQNVAPFVLLLFSKLLQDYATHLLLLAVLLHGRLELDRRFTNQVALGSGMHKGHVLYIAWSALGGGLALAFFLDYANTGRRLLLLLPTTLGHSAALETMETEGAMLTPSIKEVAAAAAEAGAAAVGAAQAAAAAAAAARGGSFGRGLDDWIVPASDALRLSWVLGTALRVDLVAQLLTVGFKALLWLLWPMLLFTSSSSSSNPTLWSTMVHVGRCRLFWLLGVARRLGESARRLGNWLGCSSESSRQSNASHDDEDDRRHSRSTNGLLGTCLDSVRSISSSGSVGSVLSGTWLWLRLMVSRLWSQGASWVRRARRRAQTTFTEFMANFPGNTPPPSFSGGPSVPPTPLRSQRSNSTGGGSGGSGSGSGGGPSSGAGDGGIGDGEGSDSISNSGGESYGTTSTALPPPPPPQLPPPLSTSPPAPRGPSQYLIYRRRRQCLAMVEALSQSWRLLLPVPLWCRYYAGTMPSIAPPPDSLEGASAAAGMVPEGGAWNEVQASQFAHVLVGVYLTLKTLVLLSHMQLAWAAVKAIWKEARHSSSSSSSSFLLSCSSSMRACLNGTSVATGGWASALPCAVGTAALTAARDSFHQSQASLTTPTANSMSRSSSGGSIGGGGPNLHENDGLSAADNTLISRCIRAVSVGAEAGSNVWTAHMDSFVATNYTGVNNSNNRRPSASSLPEGYQEEVVMLSGSPLDTISSSSSSAIARGDGASANRGAADDAASTTATTSPSDGSKVSVSRCGRLASEVDVLEAGSPDCPICFEPLCRPLALSPCGHLFCEDCAWEWLDREKTCPLCRAAVERSDDDPVARKAFANFHVTTGATAWTLYIM